MRLFDKRPLCFACSAALLLGLLFAYTGIYAVIAAAAVCAACFILVFALKYRYRKTLAVVFSAALVLCLSFSVFYITSSVVEYDDAEIKGYVLPYSENEYTQIYKITEINGKPANIKAVSTADAVRAGAFAEFTAKASLKKYGGAYEDTYKSKGIYYSVNCSGFALTGKTHKNIEYYANAVRNFAAERLYRVSDNAGILCRVFLGISDGVPQSFASDMRQLGLSHLLAVSGLHVTALLFGADLVLRRAAGKNKVNYIVLSCIALCYMLVTGLSGSVVRASLMYLISRVSYLTGRKNDPVTSLTFAAFIIVAVNPLSMYDLGFILSVTATLGITVAGSPLSAFLCGKLPSKLGFLKPVISGVLITLSALLFTLPAAAFSFGKINAGAALYNLMAAPLVTVLLYACPYAVIFSGVPFIGRGIGLLCDGICSVLMSAVRFFADRPTPSVSVAYPFVIPLVIVTVVTAGVFAVFTKKKLPYICIALSFILVFSAFAAVFSLTYAQKTVIMVSRGNRGDYIAVTSGGECTVFDLTTGGVDGFYALSSKLLSVGVVGADYVLPKDASARHIQSLVRNGSSFDINGIYAPPNAAGYAKTLSGRDVKETDGDYYKQFENIITFDGFEYEIKNNEGITVIYVE